MGEAARVAVPVESKWNWTRVEALAVLGWAPKLFDALERDGAFAGRPHGRNGATIYSAEELRTVDRKRHGTAPSNDNIDGEFEGFGEAG